VLKLKPDDFRSMSLGEFCLAMDGHMMTVGGGKKPLKWNDVLDLKDKTNVTN
jgi:hypothetical protein